VAFSRYKMFAWAPFLKPLPNAENNDAIRDSIERTLVGRGFKMTAVGQTGVYVSYWVKTDSTVMGRPTEQSNP
jgi:hypothetical protein